MARQACKELQIEEWGSGIDAVVPVPMNKRRKKKYGYNQSLYIAKAIAAYLHAEVCEWLHRSDKMISHTKLNARERAESSIMLEANIPDNMRGKTILIVDDVMTTGETMRRCLTELHEADPTAQFCIFTLALAGQ